MQDVRLRLPEMRVASADGGRAESGVRMAPSKARIQAMVVAYYDFVWRSLCHLGVPSTDVDDAAQQVFMVALRKVEAITPGFERKFLFSAAVRIAWRARRTQQRRNNLGAAASEAPTDLPSDPEQLLDQARARAVVDQILESIPFELRSVFILFEIEEFTLSEIASALALPRGTVASRLRRARELFRAQIQRLEARAKSARGPR